MMNVHPQLKNPKFYFMILADAVFFALAMVIAYWLRFEFSLSPESIEQIKGLIIWIVPLKFILFLVSGLYRGMWRYTGIHDFWLLARITSLSTLLIIFVILYMNRFEGYSRTVFIIDGFLTFLFAGGARMLIRTYYASYANALNFPGFADTIKLKKIIIVGAGDAGEKILREIKENYLLDYEVVGFIDDDPAKQGRSIHGVRVLGNIQRIDKIVRKRCSGDTDRHSFRQR